MSPQLYLASRSPRRQELLLQLGLRFETVPADVVERPRPGQDAREYALETALAKARAARLPAAATAPVLGADTDVVVDGQILGKPAGREAAVAMLLRLAGRRHEVVSAVAVVRGAQVETALSITEVEFGPIARGEAAAYWATGEPADKAGAYAIQGLGARFVRSISGSYSGVVGLPLYETGALLARFGIEVLSPTPDSAASGVSAGGTLQMGSPARPSTPEK
ncbi:MAG: septum formation inhibitor Maf [Gammaproteobacteria bacterium]|nr:septum formation inhibitor Maf [Gammaproteobacteria bacterium]